MTTVALRCADDVLPLALGAPSLRYADAGDASDNPPSETALWRPDGAHAWTFDDGRLRLRVRVASTPGELGERTLTLSATALRAVRVGLCTIELHAPTSAPPRLLDRALAWRELDVEASLGASAPLMVRWLDAGGGAHEIRSVRGAVAGALAWRDRRLRLRLHLDAAALHPRWSFAARQTRSTAAPFWPTGQQLAVTLALRAVNDGWDTPPVVAAPLPHGAEAALVITDHCDFDTTDRLHAFALGDTRHRGWVGRGVRLTKGVFALGSDVRGRAPAPTLQDVSYRALVSRLHDDGSEIAPHGVNESGNVAPAVFRAALADVARDFAPRAWIDHGLTLAYCYTMGGAEHAEYALLDQLREHGVSTLWSYHDAPTDAAGSLNTAVPAGGLRVRAARAGGHLVRGRPLVAAHYARSALRAQLAGPVGDAVGRGLSALRSAYMADGGQPVAARLRQAGRGMAAAVGALARGNGSEATPPEPYRRDELFAMAPVVYPERAVPLGQTRVDDLLLFATTEVLHTRDAYTPRAVARLVAERGVHVGHCYLLNRLPYIAGLFAEGEGARLGDEWAAFVDALSDAAAAGTVWNPVVSELAEWMRATQLVTTRPCARDAVVVENGCGQTLRGFTLLLPPTVMPADVRWGDSAPAGWRAWSDWLAVWGALPPTGRVVVRWD